MIESFMLHALAGGVGVATVAGPLGTFIVWRRMAYFGDALAHSALLGIVLGLALGFDLNAGVILVCIGLALLLLALERRSYLTRDTMLGIMAHSALSIGLVALAFTVDVRVDLLGYLFGDILAITVRDLWWIYGGGILVLAIFLWIWKPLLSMTVDPDLARVEGVAIERTEGLFVLVNALVIAVAMKIVGVLLITALLIIPAATARRFAQSPEQMAVFAVIFGNVAVVFGLAASYRFDTPTGPTIVVAGTVIFLLSSIWRRRLG